MHVYVSCWGTSLQRSAWFWMLTLPSRSSMVGSWIQQLCHWEVYYSGLGIQHFEDTVRIPVRKQMESLEPTIVQWVLVIEESPFDGYNNEPVRGIVPEMETPLAEGESMGSVSHLEELPVPDHLQSPFEQATMKQNKTECRVINQLFNSFQDVFFKHEYDLGRTHLVEHHVNIGDAPQVKLLPWKTTHVFTDDDCKGIERLKVRVSYSPHILLGSITSDGTKRMGWPGCVLISVGWTLWWRMMLFQFQGPKIARMLWQGWSHSQ